MTPAERRTGCFRVPLLAAGAFFGHAGYPALVQLLAVTRGTRALPSGTPPRAGRYASAVVPAYHEEGTIGALVRRLLTDEESPVAEVVVVADDDEPTALAAREAGATVVAGSSRAGKSDAVNRGVALAAHDVLLLMDANVEVEAAALRRLVEHVDSGRLDLAGGVRTETGSAGESMYWAFENATKAAEGRLGGSLAVVGELIALRKSTFRPIPSWVRVDDVFLAVDHAARGLRVGVDTQCVSVEPSVTPRQQLERRLRVMEAFLELLVRRPRPFLTASPPMLLLHGHRTWRSTAGPVCQVLLAVHSARAARRSPLAAAWVVLNVGAVADYLLSARFDRSPTGRWRPLLGQALGMPPAILAGAVVRLSVRRLRGGDDGTWTRVAR